MILSFPVLGEQHGAEQDDGEADTSAGGGRDPPGVLGIHRVAASFSVRGRRRGGFQIVAEPGNAVRAAIGGGWRVMDGRDQDAAEEERGQNT